MLENKVFPSFVKANVFNIVKSVKLCALKVSFPVIQEGLRGIY